MQFKFFLHFEEGSDEVLTKAWATKQELGEESEPKAPELVRERRSARQSRLSSARRYLPPSGRNRNSVTQST